MTLTQVLDIVSKVGFGGLLVVILYGGYRGVWVWGSQYQASERRTDEWKALSTRSVETLEKLNEESVVQGELIRQMAKVREREQWLREQGGSP